MCRAGKGYVFKIYCMSCVFKILLKYFSLSLSALPYLIKNDSQEEIAIFAIKIMSVFDCAILICVYKNFDVALDYLNVKICCHNVVANTGAWRCYSIIVVAVNGDVLHHALTRMLSIQ